MGLQAKTYKCAKCHGVFETDWTDEEALAEMEEFFGDLPEEDRTIVCDDCYNKIMRVVMDPAVVTEKEAREHMGHDHFMTLTAQQLIAEDRGDTFVQLHDRLHTSQYRRPSHDHEGPASAFTWCPECPKSSMHPLKSVPAQVQCGNCGHKELQK